MLLGLGALSMDVIYEGNKNPIFRIGGSLCNTSYILANLDYPVTYITKVGADREGKYIKQKLSESGVNTQHIFTDKSKPTGKIRQIVNYGEHEYTFVCKHENKLPEMLMPTPDEITDEMVNLRPKMFYFQYVNDATMMFAKKFKGLKIPVFFEPQKIHDTPEHREIVQYCDMVKYSVEPEFLPEVPLLLHTMGRNGTDYNLNYGGIKHVPAFRISNVVDTGGAGDHMTAGMLYKLLNSYSIQDAILYGHALASLSCRFIGAHGMEDVMDRTNIINLADRLIAKEKIVDDDVYASVNKTYKNMVFDACECYKSQ